MRTRAPAHTHASRSRGSAGGGRGSLAARFRKITFENPIWIVRLASKSLLSPRIKRFSVHFPCRTELLSDGPRVTRSESSLCGCLVNKKRRFDRRSVKIASLLTKGGGAFFFLFWVGSTSSGMLRPFFPTIYLVYLVLYSFSFLFLFYFILFVSMHSKNCNLIQL